MARSASSKADLKERESFPPASMTVLSNFSARSLPSSKIALPINLLVIGEGVRLLSRRHAAQADAEAWGSPSIRRHDPDRASQPARCTAIVVFPTPPFVLTMAYRK